MNIMNDIKNGAPEPCTQCSTCAQKNCPNYVRRSNLSRFGVFMMHFTLGAVCAAVLFISFHAVRYTALTLTIANLPEVPAPPAASESVPPEPTSGLGVTVMETGGMAQSAGLDGGLVIRYIEPDSAFSGTDVRVNDVIVAVDGTPILGFADLLSILAEHLPGDTVTVTIARFDDGSPTKFEVTATLIPLKTAEE